MSGAETKYFGKYRGVVTDNDDPESLGRIKAKVPYVFGDQESTWANPSVPYAGQNVGLFLIPPTNASVWIEFERGELTLPIWSGCFWESSSDVPASSIDTKVLKTDAGSITVNDQKGSGSITIDVSGLKIVIDTQKIKLTNSSQTIELSSSSVKINDDALEVQ